MVSSLLLVAFVQFGCDSPTPPEKLDGALLDAEVARRVAQIEMEQRLDELERKIEQQALTVEEKNRLIEDQRVLLAEKSRIDNAPLTTDSQVPSGQQWISTEAEEQQAIQAPVQSITRSTASDVGIDAGADYSMFYETLAPHGTWTETSEYGAIWQPAPRYTPAGWQPYTRGSWTYADVGWTWVSAEPFGWATYHYGRWNHIANRGWCWIPGNQWAPAWVSWRTGSDYVGWAPLPAQTRFRGNRISVQIGIDFDSGPGNYCFVPNRYFGSSSVYRHVVPNVQNTVIIADTVNVTNIVRTDDIVINQGPDYTTLNRVAANPIRTGRVVRNPQVPNVNATGATWSGKQLTVQAPTIKPISPARRAALQRADRITRLETVTGWEQVKSPVERQRLREQLARQNQRELARNQAIAAAQTAPQSAQQPATQTPVVPKANLIEQRAQQEAQARRLAAQRERERLIAAQSTAAVATPNTTIAPRPQAASAQTPQNLAQRQAQLRREQAQKERERLANIAAARQQSAIAQQQAQAQTRPQSQAVAPRPVANVIIPSANPAAVQAAREAQARRDQAQREREQKARVEAARQQAAINQRQAAVARPATPSRPINPPTQRPQQTAQRPPVQQPRPSAPSQPSPAQIQAMRQAQEARQAQARREAAQAERERVARQEAINQQRAQAQRQQFAAQRQNQPVRPQQITPAQQQRINAAQRQRQQQMQRP